MLAPKHPDLCRANRERFLACLDGSAALLFGAPHVLRNGDAEYRYRQNSDVIYLTGWLDPECAVLIRPGAEQPFVMFVQPREPDREIWTGRRAGPEGAVSQFGADGAFPYSELESRLPDLLQGYDTLHYRFADDSDRDRLVTAAIAQARRKARRNGLDVPSCFVDPSHTLHELRLVKSEAELDILRKAAKITCEAHSEAMSITQPGVFEYELEAVINGMFRRKGGNGPGYTTIVGGGANATILHYIENDCELLPGTLVCVDAGCEFDSYTADVTRTWPVSGQFSGPQKELYTVVLDAQKAAIAACVSGNSWKTVHDEATRVLVQGMIALGLLDGDPDDEDAVDALIEEGVHKKYYMHGTGHWLGLDVHDAGAYNRAGKARLLQPGMVMTVEPGLYVAVNDFTAPEQYRGIGIRIEDDILVTANGPENLTSTVPREISEVEALVGTAIREHGPQ